jgi:hypothetical protein
MVTSNYVDRLRCDAPRIASPEAPVARILPCSFHHSVKIARFFRVRIGIASDSYLKRRPVIEEGAVQQSDQQVTSHSV